MNKNKPSEPDQGRYPLAETEAGKKINQTVVNKTGYDPVDLLDAPMNPPELKNVRRSYSVLQFALVMVGAILAAFGLIIWAIIGHGAIGSIVMVIGAICVVIGTLVRV